MGAALRYSRRVFRSLPKNIKHHPLLQSAKDAILARMSHDQIYDHDYYDHVETWALQSAPAIASSVMRDMAPTSLIDVGCGTGAMLAEFVSRGLTGKGLEYSQDGLERCQSKGLDVSHFDLEAEIKPPERRFDVALSMEVAEHLPEAVADPYINLLCSLSDRVVMTAAPPGQLGTDHVNLQPKSYWIAKMAARGMDYCPDLERCWRKEWLEQGVVGFYWRNLMVFQRKAPW